MTQNGFVTKRQNVRQSQCQPCRNKTRSDELLANESGRIDACQLKYKYKEYYSKPFQLPSNVNRRKIVLFLENYISDTVQVTRGKDGNFIETKIKRKEFALTVKPRAKQNITKSVSTAPQPPLKELTRRNTR